MHQPLRWSSGTSATGVAGSAGQAVADGAVKDTGVIAAAMREAGTDTTLMDAVGQQFRKAADSGHGEKDMAAVYHAFRS